MAEIGGNLYKNDGKLVGNDRNWWKMVEIVKPFV